MRFHRMGRLAAPFLVGLAVLVAGCGQTVLVGNWDAGLSGTGSVVGGTTAAASAAAAAALSWAPAAGPAPSADRAGSAVVGAPFPWFPTATRSTRRPEG